MDKIMISDDNNKQLESLAAANVRMVLVTSCLHNIRDLERDFNNNGDVDAFYNAFVKEVATLTSSDYGAFGLFSSDGSVLHLWC